MTDRLAKLGVGMLAVCAIAIPVTFVATANAQQGGPQGGGVQGQNQNRFGQGQGQGQAGQRPAFGGGGFGGFGGGGSAIAASDSAVFVLQGNRVYKLNPNSLAVVAQNELPAPPAPQFQPGQFNNNRGGNRAGGGGGQQGGNTTPPPK